MSAAVTSQRQTFRKSERLCSRKILETLSARGRSINQTPFRLVWMITPLPQDVPAQIAFAVPKRNFKRAVDRNRMKRLMRESYRKNKSELHAFISEQGTSVAMLLIFTGRQLISYPETESKIQTIHLQLVQDIKRTSR